MKKLLSLFISCVMLFNLTADIFAAPRLASKEQQNQIDRVLTEAYNNSNPSSDNKDLAYYRKQYEQAFEKYINIKEQCDPLQDAIIKSEAYILGYKTLSQATLELCNTLDQTDEEFIAAQKTFDEKVEKLGGEEQISEKYQQWQEYKKDFTEIEKTLDDLQQIIDTNTSRLKQKGLKQEEIKVAKATIQAAQNNIKRIQEEYSDKYIVFTNLEQELSEITQTKSALELENQRILGLHTTCDLPLEAKELLLVNLNALPGNENITAETNLEEILNAAQTTEEILCKNYNNGSAEKKYKQAEKDLNDAIEEDLKKRIETSFVRANDQVCQDMQQKVEDNTGVAPLGLKNGQRVPLDPGSVEEESTAGHWAGRVHAAVGFNLRKEADLACVNQYWTENSLKKYNAGITMEELSYMKYGEYMATYGLEEWRYENITPEEAAKKGAELARLVILYALGNVEGAIIDHYQFKGDYYQTKYLMSFLKKDWEKQGYGSILEIPELGDEFETKEYLVRYIPSEENKDLENTTLYKSYVQRYRMFWNTRKILKQYLLEVNNILTDIMNFLAQDNVEPSDLQNYLIQIGIPLDVNSCPENYQKYVISLIAKLNKENNLTNEEKVAQVDREYQKAKEAIHYNCFLDKAVDKMWDGFQELSDNYCQNERKAKIQAYDWNNAQSIKNLLSFNARMLPKHAIIYKIYESNLAAWNALGLKLKNVHAQDLLNHMVGLGHLLDTGENVMELGVMFYVSGPYERTVSNYAKELADSMSDKTIFGIVSEILINLVFIGTASGGMLKLKNGTAVARKQMLRTGYKISLNSSISRAMRKGYTTDSLIKISRLNYKINNITKELEAIQRKSDALAASNGKYHFSSSTGWIKEESLRGSLLHQFEKKYANFLGLDVKPYRSKFFSGETPFYGKPNTLKAGENTNANAVKNDISETSAKAKRNDNLRRRVQNYKKRKGQGGNSSNLKNNNKKDPKLESKKSGSDNPAAANGTNNTSAAAQSSKVAGKPKTNETPVTKNPLKDRAPPVKSDPNAPGFNYKNPGSNPKVSVAPKKGAEIENLVTEQNGKISLNYTEEQADALIKQSKDLKTEIAEGGKNLTIEADIDNLYTQEKAAGRIFQTEEASLQDPAATQYANSELVYAKTSDIVADGTVRLYPGMKGMECRGTVKKILANMTDFLKYFSGGKPLHIHRISELGKYIQRFFNGEVTAVIQKTEKEWLVVYERTTKGEYVIGIVQENPKRGVNLFVTNYKVECNLKGLGEQFLNVEKVGPNKTMRRVAGVKQNNIVYLNENGGKQFLKDLDKLFRNVHIGDTYTPWIPPATP